MEKRVSRKEIIKMHMMQQLERKKALLVNLRIQQGRCDEWDDCADIITADDRRRYEIGMDISYPNGIFPKQFFLPNYFRGENAYYPTGKSTIYRELPKNAECQKNSGTNRIRLLISQCGEQKTTVIPEIVEAHYGIASQWLGFTSNFDEALFYACCTFDEGTGEWRPLEEKDFTEAVSENGIDRRYGVIYMADAMDVRFREGMDGNPEYNLMTPAGSQPLMEGTMQYAYAMRMRREDDLVNDVRFDRLVFEHSEVLCRDIYKRMEGGRILQNHKKLIK